MKIKENIKKIKAAMLPLLASIGFGIIALVAPFLSANHYIWADGVRYNVDNYLFFFWGKYYTVVGEKLIQSKTVLYDQGDFPIYAMIVVIIGLILATTSLFAGRGRIFKINLNFNPIWYQFSALLSMLIAFVYMVVASESVILLLMRGNYVVEPGPSLYFLLGSVIMLSTSTIMTTAKYIRNKKLTLRDIFYE